MGEAVTSSLSQVFSILPFFGLLFVALYLGKLVYDKTTSYHFDDELTNKDNPAFGAHLALYMVGLAIALTGVLFGASTDVENLGREFGSMAIYAALAIILVRLSVWVNDRCILNKFSIEKEMIQDRNVGTAFVVGGSCVATGLIINGAMTGFSEGILQGIRDVVIYFAVGQVILIAGSHVFQAITSYDVHQVIEHDNNVAAGISFGGFLVALGIITRASLVGASSDILAEIVTTLIIAAIGIVILVAARVIADRVILPKSPLSKEVAVDKNAGAAAVAASVFICLALVFSAAITI